MPCSEAFTPAWKDRLFSERGKGLDSQEHSLLGTIVGSFDLSCPFQLEGQWKPQRLFCQGKLETLFQSHIVPWDQFLARKAEYGSQFLNLFHFFLNKGNKSNCHFSEIKQVERVFLAFQSPKGQQGLCLGQGRTEVGQLGPAIINPTPHLFQGIYYFTFLNHKMAGDQIWLVQKKRKSSININIYSCIFI